MRSVVLDYEERGSALFGAHWRALCLAALGNKETARCDESSSEYALHTLSHPVVFDGVSLNLSPTSQPVCGIKPHPDTTSPPHRTRC